GDSKQSIFRFRGADVTVFDSFKLSADSFKSLNTNYRSLPSILSFINAVFEKIIGNEPKNDFEAVYSHMNPHRPNDNTIPSMELNVFDFDSADVRRMNEAECVARRAKEIVEDSQDEKNGEKITYSNMALLLRNGSNVSYYEEAFLRAGIPFVNKIGGRLSGSPVAYDIGNLLAWLSHPEDPVLLTAVLISPFFNMDSDTLLSIKTMAGSAEKIPPLIVSNADFQSEDVKKTFGILKLLLSMSGRISICDILRRAFEETDYTLTLLADRIVGEQSLAVLDLILDTADAFEHNGGTAAGFAELLLSGEQFTTESAHVETQDDALSIMTIHGSKGLEFKIVFLADITSRGRSDSSGIVFDDDLGPGFQIRDMHRGRLKTFVNRYTEDIERKKHIAESKRLFYVACTRAEDRLIISGGPPSKNSHGLYEKDNWMSWLHTALSISPDGDISDSDTTLFVYDRISENTSSGARSITAYWSELMNNAANYSGNDYPVDTLTAPVERVPVSGVPTHISPNQIIDYTVCPALYMYKHVQGLNLSQSESLAGMSGGMGASYGSFAHSVLEKLDYHDLSGWERCVEERADNDMPESLKKNLSDSLWKFSESDLFSQITKAEELHREEPFTFIENNVLVRGVIDLFFIIGDELVVVDFKTGKNIPGAENEIPEDYRLQLEIYALALSKALDIVPSKLILHYLGVDLSVKIPCGQDTLDTVTAQIRGSIDRMSEGDYRPVKSLRCEKCPYKVLCEVELFQRIYRVENLKLILK
ncbi:UvrD-helicase domain-containing protein, partial [Candidatus Latescibacterota bacterium]